MRNASTAILLFSRSAAAEAAEKSFGGDAAKAVRATGKLIERTERTLAQTGFPIYRSTEKDQRGATFGRRLATAMAGVFAEGFARVLVVGNDCPFIRPAHLRAAAHLLAGGKNVLGPDRRGGVWLIGLQREHFRENVLASLRWETGHLFEDLAAHLPQATNFSRLADLNTLSDLRASWHVLRRQLADLYYLLAPVVMVGFRLAVYPPRIVLRHRPGRAPPC